MVATTNFFSEIINRQLQEQERSYTWLARRLGVAPSTVSRWVDGYTRPHSPEQVIRLTDILHIHAKIDRQAMLAALGYAYMSVEPTSPAIKPPIQMCV